MTKKRRKVFRFRLRWKDHFTFSVHETRGIFILLVILSLEIAVLYYIRFVHRPGLPEGWERLVSFADSLDKVERLSDSLDSNRDAGRYSTRSRTTGDSVFTFDPNRIGKQDWMALGLTSRQAEAVIRYRSRIGRFHTRSELSRISVIPRTKLSKWMPYMLLPDSEATEKRSLREDAVDVNAADSAALERLKGIGPALAGRIIRYRERLGGYASREQIREVYGMNDTVWQSVRAQLKVSGGFVLSALDINSVSEDSLRRHPYIGYALARQIVAYRHQHPFRSVDELHRLPLYSEEISRKLAPYLVVGD